MTKLSHSLGFGLKPVPPYDFRGTVENPGSIFDTALLAIIL